MFLNRLACAAMWTSASLTTLICASLGAGPARVPELAFEKYQLDNGLTVILHHDPRLPLVAVNVWYDVGARHERAKRSGFAHLFEHMMFQGSVHVGEDNHFNYLQSAGATGMNGTTSFDRTNYFQTVPKNHLELALWLESDRMGFLLPSLTQKSLQNQIEVVQNERRQSVENRAYGLMNERIMQTLYPEPHPYYGNVIGSMKDISAASLDDVKDFFKTYYTPANAVLTLAGDFNPDTIKSLIAQYFGTLRGRAKPSPVTIPAPVIAQEKIINYEEPVGKLSKMTMIWMGPSIYQADTAELDLLTHIISGTKSSRLDRKVSFEDQLAQSVTAYFSEKMSGSQFHISITLRPGRTPEEAKAAVDEVLANLHKNPITEAELRRAQNAFESGMIRGLEKLGGFSGRADLLQRYNLYLNDPGKLGWDLLRYRNATVAGVTAAFKKHLNTQRLIVYARPQAAAAPKSGGAK
jgi:zinc protease